MSILRYEKNEKQRILEMHKRASRPLYENFNKEEELDEFFFDDIADTPEGGDIADTLHGEVADDNLCFSFDDIFVISSNDVSVDPSKIEGAEVIGEYSSYEEFKSAYPEVNLFNGSAELFDKYVEKYGTGLKVYNCGGEIAPKGE